jgi:hypothetical protein
MANPNETQLKMQSRLLERWGESDYLKVDRDADVKNCSLTIYDYDRDKKKLVLNAYNTICYLERSAQSDEYR